MADVNGSEKLSTELVHQLYESNQQLIYVADRKVSALLLINAVLISLSATWRLKEYSASVKAINLIGVLFAVLSTVFYLLAIIPRISEKASESMLHYRGILAIPRDDYVAKMCGSCGDDLIRDYLETIYALSSIQMRKNRYLRLGSVLLMISIVLLGLSFMLHNL